MLFDLLITSQEEKSKERERWGAWKDMGGIWKKALSCMGSREAGVFSRTFPGAKKEEEEVPSSFFGSQDIRPPFPASFLLPLLFPFLRSRGFFPPPRAPPMT